MVKFIREFDISINSIDVYGETRRFSIIGDVGAKFELEVKNSTLYYDWRKKALTTDRKVLIVTMQRERYQNRISFPSVASQGKSNDSYTLTLTAISDNCATTQHVPYVEVRDGSGKYIGPINENASIGSNDISLKKTITQGPLQTWNLQPYGANDPTTWPTMAAVTVGSVSPRGSFKSNFSMRITADANEAIKIDRQPTSRDFFYMTTANLSAELLIEGEDIFDGGARDSDGVNVGGSGGGTETDDFDMSVDIGSPVKWAVGDRVKGNAELDEAIVLVDDVNVGGDASMISLDTNVTIANGATLTFTPPRNYRFPVDNIVDLRAGMNVRPTLHGGGSVIGSYSRSLTIKEYIKKDCDFELVGRSIPLVSVPAIEGTGVPTFANGSISAQAGNICFEESIGAEFGAGSYAFQGYGVPIIEDITGAKGISFTNLKVEILDANVIRTTISDASANNINSLSDFDVASKDGIMDDVSRVRGVNFDTSAGADPLVTTIGSSTSTNITVTPGGHVLQNGQTVEFTGAAKIITITGDIAVKDIGFTARTLYLDVSRFLTIASNA